MSKSIEMVVTENADVTIEAIGFEGKGCEKATKALEELLGLVKKKTKKPAFYKEQNINQSA